MTLPETIPVRYTEEEAEYVSVRPVRRQTFRLAELLDMILSVTGKDAARVRQILRSGTIMYHNYRYWWPGIEPGGSDLAALLARYPDADPARAFRAEECVAILLESTEHPLRDSVELPREEAGRRRLFRGRSVWDSLLDLARARAPEYAGYSYARHADLFRLAVTPEKAAALLAEAARLASRALRPALEHLPQTSRIVYVCPRR